MMKNRKFEAVEKIKSGCYNCAQSVICTYCDKTGLDEQTSFNLGNSFACGMGNMEGSCGALVGAGIILGLIDKNKVTSLKNMRQIISKFQERNGATQCKILKGKETGEVLRHCPDCVADVCDLLEEVLEN